MAQESTTASSPQKPSLEPSTSPVRIGLLVNSATVAKYDAEFIAWTETQPDIEVTHLILHAPKSEASTNTSHRGSLFNRAKVLLAKQGLGATLAGIVWQYIEWSERRILAKNDELLRDHLDTVDVSERVPHQLSITPMVSPSGFVYRFSDDDTQAVRELDLDLSLIHI